ncbi:MAG: FimB/Mfa2 family fimbrial subunit [Prevotellaceae bacterium]|nr:FimB/Mfa2 family fimbrial subunit [Prevotellaceae bacterium]
MLSFIRRNGVKAAAWAAICLALTACNGLINDGEGDCEVNYKVRFKYDYNMKYADAFAHEVESVTLYLVDGGGDIVWQKTEQGEALAEEGYMMDVDVAPGQYSLLAWCGTVDKGTFTIPQSTVATGLTCTLNRRRDAAGNAYVDTDLDRLYHGYLADQTFPDDAGTHTYTVSLVKDTNVLRVVLQQMSGETVDKDKFTFTITDDNGSMDWDNSVLADEDITYYAWHTDQGEATFDMQAMADEFDTSSGAATRSTFSAAIAELTTARLMTDHSPRLRVTDNETEETVFSIPLIDYALLVKGFYNADMDDQEYLDRQDEWNMTFFLDEGYRWIDSYIYINSWKVVLQNTGL